MPPQRRHTQKIALERRAVERALCDGRNERVIARGASRPIAVRGLRLDLIQKDVRVRFHLRGLEAVPISDGANKRRARDRDAQRSVNDPAGRARRRAVCGVTNRHARRGAGDRDREVRRVEPAATRSELEVFDEGVRARAVERAGRWRPEVMVGWSSRGFCSPSVRRG